jgi:hypothetical protein
MCCQPPRLFATPVAKVIFREIPGEFQGHGEFQGQYIDLLGNFVFRHQNITDMFRKFSRNA